MSQVSPRVLVVMVMVATNGWSGMWLLNAWKIIYCMRLAVSRGVGYHSDSST